MKIHFFSSSEKTLNHFSSRISRERDSCQGLLSGPTSFLTVFVSCFDQVLGTVEQAVPGLLHHLFRPEPSPKAEALYPPVV